MAVPFAESAHRSRPTTTEVVAAGGVAALAVAFVLSPHDVADGPVVCPFRRVTGLPCPGCGLTRSWVYLAHGWWREALVANPFGAVAVVLAVVLAGAMVRARVLGTAPPSLDRLAGRRWVQAVVVAWLAFAVARVVVDLVGF